MGLNWEMSDRRLRTLYINLRRRSVRHFGPYLSIKYGLCTQSIKKAANRQWRATVNGCTRSNWYEIALEHSFHFVQSYETKVNRRRRRKRKWPTPVCTMHAQNTYIDIRDTLTYCSNIMGQSSERSVRLDPFQIKLYNIHTGKWSVHHERHEQLSWTSMPYFIWAKWSGG